MIAHPNLIKDLGRVIFWFPLRFILNFLPFSSIYWIGTVLGHLDYYFSGRLRVRKMLKNVQSALALNEEEARRIIKDNLKNHFRNVLELMRYPRLSEKNLRDFVSFRGLRFLDDEMKSGRGVIIATSHFGAKQLLQVGLGLKGYKVNQISLHLERGELSFIQKHVSQKQRKKIEEKIPAKFIPAKGFLRPAYESLKRKEILIIAGDGAGLAKYIGKEYSPFRFLGRKMFFPRNMASLARKTGSSIVPAFVVRNCSRHTIVIEKPLEVYERSVDEIFIQYVRLLEKYVRKYPFLWEFWEEFEKGNLIASKRK